MNLETAHRRSRAVGVGSLALGAGLLICPARLSAVADLDPRDARVIAACDLALVPGLLAGRRRWAWIAARAITNLGIITRLATRSSPRAQAGAAALGLLTVADLRVAIALRATATPATTTEAVV